MKTVLSKGENIIKRLDGVSEHLTRNVKSVLTHRWQHSTVKVFKYVSPSGEYSTDTYYVKWIAKMNTMSGNLKLSFIPIDHKIMKWVRVRTWSVCVRA